MRERESQRAREAESLRARVSQRGKEAGSQRARNPESQKASEPEEPDSHQETNIGPGVVGPMAIWIILFMLIFYLLLPPIVDCTCTGSLLQWFPELTLDITDPINDHDDV